MLLGGVVERMALGGRVLRTGIHNGDNRGGWPKGKLSVWGFGVREVYVTVSCLICGWNTS